MGSDSQSTDVEEWGWAVAGALARSDVANWEGPRFGLCGLWSVWSAAHGQVLELLSVGLAGSRRWFYPIAESGKVERQ